jgi:hypothetical protein
MCAFVLTALPLGLYVNVFDFVESPGSTYVSVPALCVHPVSFLKSAGFGLFSDKPNEAVVGFTHASAASPTRIDESEETKEKAEMAKTLLFLRSSLPLFFFFFSRMLVVVFIRSRLSCILKILCVLCREICQFLVRVFFLFLSRIISRKKKKTKKKTKKQSALRMRARKHTPRV